jgi:hypothetical protein
MFTAYLDDSGTDPKQKVAIASALVIPAAQIVALEKEWSTFARKENFSSLHTSEMVALNPKSEFALWDENKQSRVIRRSCEIAKKYSIYPSGSVSYAINKADYDQVVPEEFREYLGRHHYTWAFRNVLHALYTMREKRELKAPLEFVFDWMELGDPRRIEVENAMAQAEKESNGLGKYGEFTNYSFRRRQDVPGLQCVDGISWTCYRKALEVFIKTPMVKLAEQAWHGYEADLGEQSWLMCYTFIRPHLEKWVKTELSGEKARKVIENWRASQSTESRGL